VEDVMSKAKRSMKAAGLVLGCLVVAGAAGLGAQPLDPGSRVWVEGTSTVRGYTCEATALDSDVRLATDARTVPLQQLVQGAVVAVAVDALDCANGTMNGHMRKALKSKEHPRITFTLETYTMDGATAVLEGALELAGRTNPVRIQATVAEAEDGLVRVSAEHEIRMTEWGVKPPSLMLGTMKVHDPVTIHFDVKLQR
jgi:polyisoprenoid-binding protein YceI